MRNIEKIIKLAEIEMANSYNNLSKDELVQQAQELRRTADGSAHTPGRRMAEHVAFLREVAARCEARVAEMAC